MIFDPVEISDIILEVDVESLIVPRSSWEEDRCKAKIREIDASMTGLLGYLDLKLRDPIAAELFHDDISQAREFLKQDVPLCCSAALCRLALEQSLRRICERNQIPYEIHEKTEKLLTELQKKEIFRPYEIEKIRSMYGLAGEIIHGSRDKKDKDEVNELIDFAEKFIDQYEDKS
jgi:hypothetical protein